MSTGFVAVSPTDASRETRIVSSTFWPAIEPEAIREAQRIDGTVTEPRLKGALIEAIATTNAALAEWRAARQANGIASLADVDAEKIDDTSILVHRYLRAVGCLAKALILERYRDMDSTGKGEKKAEAQFDTIDDCRRDYHNAIADIIGRRRVTVEII